MMGKKLKVSKNKKKTWRKFGDVEDVENFLQLKRLQERHGGVVEEKSNKELFYMDCSASEQNNIIRPNLKSERFLKPLNNVPPITKSYHNKKSKPKTRRALKHEYKRLIKRKKHRESGKIETTTNDDADDICPIKNLWPSNDQPGDSSKTSHRLLRPSKLQAILPPHPGMSYNPMFKDHQNLLLDIVSKEQKECKVKEKIMKGASVKSTLSENLELEKFKEMCEGLPLDVPDKEATLPDVDNHLTALMETLQTKIPTKITELDDEIKEHHKLLPVACMRSLKGGGLVSREKKKTKSQKRKRVQLKLKKKIQKELKTRKSKNDDINNIKRIKKEIAIEETEAKAKLLRRKFKDNLKADGYVTKRLSKYKFTEQDLSFKLGSDLPQRIRDLKPEGNILLDCYKSFQRRNMIEVSESYARNSQNFNDPHRLYKDRVSKNHGNKKRVSSFVRNALKDLAL